MYRPEPVVDAAAIARIDCKSDWNHSARALVDGERLLVTDLYSTGLNTLAALRKRLAVAGDDDSFTQARDSRSAFRAASNNLLAPIAAHRLDLGKAPDIGWFPELYPDVLDFLLPFPQVQGLNSSWQWFQRGIDIPVLSQRLHPFYGTYFPTRFAHLQLLQDWLQTWAGPRNLAWDVGTGCGVMALMLAQAGFDRILATDSNANAVESLRRELVRQDGPGRIEVAEADLLDLPVDEQVDAPVDESCDIELILFNPPWLRGDPVGPIDRAIYYEAGLFERFFEQAAARIAPQGRVVLLFSNLQEAADAAVLHPVEAELRDGGRFVLAHKASRQAQASAPGPKRRKRNPATETVELWELKPTP